VSDQDEAKRTEEQVEQAGAALEAAPKPAVEVVEQPKVAAPLVKPGEQLDWTLQPVRLDAKGNPRPRFVWPTNIRPTKPGGDKWKKP